MGWRSQQYGSFERFLVALAARCAQLGAQTHLVFTAPPASETFVRDVHARVHAIPSPRSAADPRFAFALARLLADVRCTHLHTHFGVDAYHALALPGPPSLRRRFSTKHITPGSSRLTAARLRHGWLAARVEVLFAVSRAVERDLLALGAPAEKVRVTHLGVDTAAYRPDPATRAAVRKELGLDGRRVALATSHLRPGKGVEALPWLAAELARDPGAVSILVAGGGPLVTELERSARELGVLGDGLRLLGVRHDVPRLLSAADLYLFPTTGDEGLPLAPLEALAAGVPVVASGVSDLPQLIGNVAQIVPPGRREALLGACRRLLGTHGHGVVERGRALIEEELDVRRAADAYAESYFEAQQPAGRAMTSFGGAGVARERSPRTVQD